MNPKTIESIQKDYNQGKYKTQLPMVTQSKYKEGHVFDENQTVVWNRDEVKKQNEIIQKKIEERRTDSNRLQRQLEEDIISAAMYEYPKLNEQQIRKIYGYVYQEHHSIFNDVFSTLYEILDLFEDVQELK